MKDENQKLDLQKIDAAYNKSKNRASELLKDKKKVKETIDEAANKATKVKGSIEKIWYDFQLLISLLRDYSSGNYSNVSLTTIIVMLGGVIYFLSPVDVLPDFIVGIGYFDDVFVISQIINQVKTELQKYSIWKHNEEQ